MHQSQPILRWTRSGLDHHTSEVIYAIDLDLIKESVQYERALIIIMLTRLRVIAHIRVRTFRI